MKTHTIKIRVRDKKDTQLFFSLNISSFLLMISMAFVMQNMVEKPSSVLSKILKLLISLVISRFSRVSIRSLSEAFISN